MSAGTVHPAPTVHQTLGRIQHIVSRTQRTPGRAYMALHAVCGLVALVGGAAWAIQIRDGLMHTGLNSPVGWGVYITDFVFWVGIAHSGTLISAILFLFRARFRTAVYRAAEGMTVIGVMTAGLFPIIHLGRPWFAYWLFPYPNTRHLWINFRSPLVWDVFAVSTYFMVSTLFFVAGMVPDAASLRDTATGLRKKLYTLMALGWHGTDDEWRHYMRGYMYLAAFATPLVISVHSVVAWDFAVSIVPGWHSTLFPSYFVAGAIFSGVAMVVLLLIPLRKALGVEALITQDHLDLLSRLVLLTSLIVSYSYATEFAVALMRKPSPESSTLIFRATGPYWPFFWTMVLCNCLAPLSLFFRKTRRSEKPLALVMAMVVLGMWLERFVIISTSLSHDRNPFSWRLYHPHLMEMSITAGSFGWFFFWFLLFVRLFPAVSIAELKEEAAHDTGVIHHG